MLVVAFAVVASLLIPAYAMVSAQTGQSSNTGSVEDSKVIPGLTEQIKQKIEKRVPLHLQSHVEEIFKLAKQKSVTTDEFEKQRLEQMINDAEDQMRETSEKNKEVYEDNKEVRKIQNAIRELEGIPLVTSLVSVNALTILLDPSAENQGWEEKILDLVTEKNLDVKIGYGSITIEDYGCSSKTDDCDPLQGGLYIEDSYGTVCTLGLPVKQGSTIGYITAGHCFSNEADVYQPEDHWFWNQKIGTINSDDNIDNNYCDCAFITDTNSRTDESIVWMEDWYSTDITGTTFPSINDTLVISGAASDWWYEDVYDVSYILPDGLDVILFTDSGIAQPGDSGSPVYVWENDDLAGILKGRIYITVDGDTNSYIIVVPWALISDNTNGLGVSLI